MCHLILFWITLMKSLTDISQGLFKYWCRFIDFSTTRSRNFPRIKFWVKLVRTKDPFNGESVEASFRNAIWENWIFISINLVLIAGYIIAPTQPCLGKHSVVQHFERDTAVCNCFWVHWAANDTSRLSLRVCSMKKHGLMFSIPTFGRNPVLYWFNWTSLIIFIQSAVHRFEMDTAVRDCC